MRGFVVSEYLHPSQISVSSGVPEPKIADGQVLVDVYSAGLNFFDVRALDGNSRVFGSSLPTHRFCRPRGNIKSSPLFRLYLVQNSQGEYQRILPSPRDVPSNLATESSVPRRGHMRTRLRPTLGGCCLCPTQ